MRIRSFLFCLLLLPGVAHAKSPFVSDKVKTVTYNVSGTSLLQIRNQMNKRGPNGHWAFTKTNWRWDGRCNMRFSAQITMPNLTGRNKLSERDLATWDRMHAALLAHEMLHVDIGRAWAAEIKAANCRDADVARINQKWGDRDAALDRQTNHGRTQGVFLIK